MGMHTAAPPFFLPSVELNTGIFPAMNLRDQLPLDIAQETVPATAPMQATAPFPLWGVGENWGGEGKRVGAGGGGPAGEDLGRWQQEGEQHGW